MSHLLPLLVITLLILALLLYWFRRSSDHAITRVEFLDAESALTSLQWQILPSGSVGRIFASEDCDFISSQTTRDIQRLFQQERKALAISWLRQTRKQIARLMDLHLKLASYTDDPGPAVEFKLATHYLSFIVVCRLLLVLLWIRGPFRVQKVVGYTTHVAHSLCTVFSSRLVNINPARLGPITPGSAYTSTVD